jgi:hypothetical protein
VSQADGLMAAGRASYFNGVFNKLFYSDFLSGTIKKDKINEPLTFQNILY